MREKEEEEEVEEEEEEEKPQLTQFAPHVSIQNQSPLKLDLLLRSFRRL